MRNLAPLAVLVCVSSLVVAQEAVSDIPGPTIRASTRLVLVDVLVTDKTGRPVTDLAAQDFALLEEGKPQALATFAPERPQTPTPRKNLPALPPDVYTNRPTYRAGPGPLTILLLDALNTTVGDQSYARREMLDYLHTQLQPGRRMAVLALTSQLHFLQDFTGDPELLRRAVEAYIASDSRNLSIEDVEKRLPPPPSGGGGATYAVMINSLRKMLLEQAVSSVDERAEKTLQAFRTLAQSVAGLPGRKSLIWVSGSFPLTFAPQTRPILGPGQLVDSRNYEPDIRRTAQMLADAQVAVYPVDAHGLGGAPFMDASQPLKNDMGHIYAGDDLREDLSRSSEPSLNARAAMEEIAGLTGGLAFVSRNDIDNAVASSVADGSSYYTLGYYPKDKNWDGQFRTVQVKVARSGLHLRYRRGYYATDLASLPVHAGSKEDAELMSELRNVALPASLVVFDARVSPSAAAGGNEVAIDFRVDLNTLSFELMSNQGHHYNVDFHAVAFTPDGQITAHRDSRLDAPVAGQRYEQLIQEGLPYRTSLTLPPGRYQLRLMVRDNRTGFLGSLDVPLVLEEPKKPK
ncbi:MAG: VWA domain-containing protein [Acidobacteriia bacterium]|nr:VWA domain-containing protein [Terriglobia bacterium]